MSIVLDNNQVGAVGEYIKENAELNSTFTITSPIFTIYAFDELRNVLEKSGKFNFLFNEPTFIKKIVSNDKEVKEFQLQMQQRERNISEFKLEIGSKNNLDQNQIASKCYDFIKEKGEIRSVIKSGYVTPSNILVQGENKSYLIQGNNVSFSKDGLGYTDKLRFDFKSILKKYEQLNTDINRLKNEYKKASMKSDKMRIDDELYDKEMEIKTLINLLKEGD